MKKLIFFLLTFSILGSAIALQSCSTCESLEKVSSSNMEDCHDKTNEMAQHDCCPLCHISPQYIIPSKIFKIYLSLTILDQINYSNNYQTLNREPRTRPPIFTAIL